MNPISPHLVEMQGVYKSFGAVQALSDINVHINHGEVLGLVGDNGAGKSTLVKVLNGAHKPDKGVITFNGERVRFNSPLDSRKIGIEMIYQDFALVESLDICSNIFLGKEITIGIFSPLLKFLLRRKMEAESSRTLEDLGINSVDVNTKVGDLSGGERQLVAVARGMHFQPKLFIMDEPTANLSVGKIDTLLRLVNDLKQRGVSTIVISHRLEDILTISDRIVVLWRGRIAGELLTKEANMDNIVKLMMFGKQANNEIPELVESFLHNR